MLHTAYFLIANAAAARLYSRDDEDRPLRLVREFQHPESRLKSAELGDGKAGREAGSSSFGGAAFEPRLDAHRKEPLRFAHELCVFLEHEAQRGAFDSLVLFAPDPFLGELNSALGPACKHRLSFESDTDLSHIGPAELGKRVARALHPER